MEHHRIVLPEHLNDQGNLFGGYLLKWIDEFAYITVNIEFPTHQFVTIAMDNVEFLAPIPGGHFMILKAMVNYTGRTSMEIGVRVEGEDPRTGDITHTSSAYLTFVGLDDRKKPAEVPAVVPGTDDEKRRYAEAEKRVDHRRETRRD